MSSAVATGVLGINVCPACKARGATVFDSRFCGNAKCRKRECHACGHRWETLEMTVEEWDRMRKVGRA